MFVLLSVISQEIMMIMEINWELHGQFVIVVRLEQSIIRFFY